MLQTCRHCGDKSFGKSFCCSGCEFAYKLIHESGLEHFYKQAQGSKPEAFSGLDLFSHSDFLKENTWLNEESEREGFFRIEGLRCPACIWLVERLPQLEAFCLEARVFYSDSKLFLRWRDSPEALFKIAKLLARLGYPIKGPDEKPSFERSEWIRLGVTAFSSIATMHLGLFFLGGHFNSMAAGDARVLGWFSALLAAPAIFYGGWPFVKNTWAALLRGLLHPDVLVAVGILFGYFYSCYLTLRGEVTAYFDSMTMVVFFLLSGKMLLRHWSKHQLKKGFISARRRRGDSYETIPAGSLEVGDIICIESGESVPVDAELLSDSAQMDFSSVTGESLPRFVQYSERLPQYAINLGKAVEVRVSARFSDSSASLALERISQSEEDRTRSGLIQVFSVAVLLMAGITAFLPIHNSAFKAVAILIVSCPCALLLAEPLGLGYLRQWCLGQGIALIRSVRVWNVLKAKRIYFDKTGTLTEGRMEVLQAPEVNQENRESFGVLFSMLKTSLHPVAQSIRKLIASFDLPVLQLESLKEIPGYGLRAEFDGRHYELRAVKSLEGPSSEFISGKDRIALFECRDPFRKEIEHLFQKLKSQGFVIEVLSGDASKQCEQLKELYSPYLDRVESNLSPDEKSRRIQSESIYIGDGLNDFSALHRAGFGIGLQGSAESQFGSADAYLLKPNLLLIPYFISTVRAAWRRLKLNYIISLVYNILAISLIFAGAIGPVLCAIFMPLSSVSVMLIARWPYKKLLLAE